MDKEIKQMFQIILDKLNGMEKRQESMDNKLESIEKRQESMDNRLESIEKRQESMDNRLKSIEKRQESMDNRLKSIEKRQDEMYIMQRALEENIKVTRAEHEKMVYVLADIQGKVTKLTEEVEEHETVINQLRAIK